MEKRVRFECPIEPDDLVTVEVCTNPEAHPDERLWIPAEHYRGKFHQLHSLKLFVWLKDKER